MAQPDERGFGRIQRLCEDKMEELLHDIDTIARNHHLDDRDVERHLRQTEGSVMAEAWHEFTLDEGTR